MRKAGQWLGYAAAIILLAAILWLSYITIDLFNAASTTARLGVLTAAVSVATFVYNNSKQQTREIKARQFADKREAYQQFFDFLFDIFSAQKKGIEYNEDNLIDRMHSITKNLMVWGSANTINQYNSFMKISNNPNISTTDRFNNVEILLRSFRKDLGHDDKILDRLGLTKLIVKAEDHDKLN